MKRPTEIPTRVHGYIDYSLAGLFAAAAASEEFTPFARRTLGIMGAARAGYSAVTDYEAGLRPWLTMRQHLALDTALGVLLVGGGLTLRGSPGPERALLVAAGLAELGVVALSSARPVTGPAITQGTPAYQPVDTPKPIAEGVFLVDSELPGWLGAVLPVRMTVIKLADGSLLLHSPTRLTEPLRDALVRIGPVSHLVAPNVAHWMLLKPWQQAFPDATTWAAPGLRERGQVRRSDVRLDRDIPREAPATWGGVIEVIMVTGGFGFHEAVLFHKPTRTLVLTDLVVNLETAKLPWWGRAVVRLFGSGAPDGMPPPYLRLVVKLRRQEAAAAVEHMLALKPERAVFAHGRYFTEDTTAQLRRSLRWLLER